MDLFGFALVLVTIAIFTALGLWYSKGKRFSLGEFITHRDKVSAFATVATLVASGMGAWILFSPAEAAVTGGIAALMGYALGSASALFVFIWLGAKIREMMPGGQTLAEFILRRFGLPMYVFVLFITAFYMGTFLTAELTGISQAAEMVFGIPVLFTAVLIGLGTMAYAIAGGFRASVFTDIIQFVIIIPLLAVIFIASLFYFGAAPHSSASAPPFLLDLGFWSGIEYGLTLIIAIVGAELFNQGNWQRVYSVNKKMLRKSFLFSGLIIIPIILVVGLFGIFAAQAGVVENPSVAMFSFVLKVTPPWVWLGLMVLAVALMMSTMDTLLNGLVSLFVVDLLRIRPDAGHDKVLFAGRIFTAIVGIAAVFIAVQGYSVLYLFLVADLVCVAAAFPVIFGMFSKRLSGKSAVIASVAGIVFGGLFFPLPDYGKSVAQALFGVSGFGQSLFISFFAALIVSGLFSVLLSRLFDARFDFRELKKVVPLEK